MGDLERKADAVFEGGGITGIALVGALQGFEEAGFHWQNVAGTSAGAITAALVAVGYSATELKEIMDTQVDFPKLLDAAGIGKLWVLGPWLSFLVTKGMYQGDYFLNLMRKLIAEKKGKQRVTFADLIMDKVPGDSEEDYQKKYRHKLQVVASDISRNEMLCLPQDIDKLGLGGLDDLEVALAVRMSMSIPFLFKPVIMRERGKQHWIVDGGMLRNFPIDLFDSPAGQKPPWPTFGFLLCEGPHDEHIRDPISWARAMVNTMITAHDRKALERADKHRIVKIPVGKYSANNFELEAKDRAWLYNSGYQAARQFLDGPPPWDFNEYVARQLECCVSKETARR